MAEEDEGQLRVSVMSGLAEAMAIDVRRVRSGSQARNGRSIS